MRTDLCPCSVTTATKPDSGLSYRSWFADEYVAWLNAWLDRIDAEILAHQLEELERRSDAETPVFGTLTSSVCRMS
ncbi:MAG TPA: hypothetical protein VGV06_02510 [Methylomirabilota bacterium]|nr:hypothetical protein [Methylomirabilota bacterium]